MTSEERELALAAKREYNRKYYKKNKKDVREYHKEWRAKNPDKVRGYQQNYWIRKGKEMSEG